ncbi:MAG TPA: ABC transporter substrate-binding protein [Acidobacteriota bacterium]|nr:ABC transporter substrate-binding protein [Acidobacteriota bacterium]HNH85226.1 ABC transporter substrate-binding protein [Acidobacteriota bacterium]HNJ42538.1 ABC transporter substrate-binding protein [Acidobacteriota bacterium]
MHKLACLGFLALLPFLLASGCRRNQQLTPGLLVMATEKAPKSIDPRVGNDSVSARLHQLLFNTLVTKNDKLEIVPELATFEVSPDAKTFTFHLKPGVMFHNGKPLTAEDVKYTFDTLRDPNFNSAKKGDFIKVEVIEAPDPQTVIFRCKEPNSPMLVSLVAIGIIPKDSGATAETKPIGTGPFKVGDYQVDREITMEAFPQYFEGAPKLEKVRVRFIPDSAVRELELRQGGVQLAVNADLASDTVEKLAQTPNLTVWQSTGTNISHLGLNCDDPILKNVKVRQALVHAINRESFIKNVLRNMARPAYGPLPPEQWAYPADLPKLDYDPALAKKLLDEAGYRDPDGDGPQTRLKLEIKTSSLPLARQIATVLQEQFKQVGIQLEIRSFEFQTFLSDVNAGNFQLYTLTSIGANQHPDYLSYAFDSSRIPTKEKNYSEGANRSHYRNAEVDGWLRKAGATLNQEEQKQLYGLAQKKIVEEVPTIFLWYPNNVAIGNNKLTNVKPDLSGSYTFLRNSTFQ